MSSPATVRHASSVQSGFDPRAVPIESAPWLSMVADKVKSIRFGVVQIVVHDSKVVQIERTERTRFEVPPSLQGR
jgi:hypothetical protein